MLYNYEIDFLPVGNGNKSGDAIAMRWWSGEWSKDDQKVMVIDGGTKESGQKLVKHIKEYYKTDRVDYIVNTHPDQDHASGLTEVLENLSVGELWIHRPWMHVDEIIRFVDGSKNKNDVVLDGRVTERSLRERFEGEYYQYAKELEEIALRKGVDIREPYVGSRIGEFVVLSPDQSWYLRDLIPNSDKTKEFKLIQENREVGFMDSFKQIFFSVPEKFGIETLRDGGKTSRENESSVILYGNLGHGGILFTGDAGNDALMKVCEISKMYDINIAKDLSFIQVPHHGSRRNIGPSVLNRLIGKPGSREEGSITAFVSAGKDDSVHPRRVVVNAFIRRGCKVITTKGNIMYHHRGEVPPRNWKAAKPLEFFEEVESYD